MKNSRNIHSKIALLLGLVFITSISCDRDLTEDAELAGFGSNPEVYIDGFSAGLEYLPFAGSVLNAFTVDDETKYDGTSAMRFDVPNVGDPTGAFAGAIFPDFTGRDLTAYDALTFWAKATQAGTINEIGFGTDFGENKYTAVIRGLPLTTNWRKYIIPIPDPSKLTQEKGLFGYAEGPEDGAGYTFWIDELQYEKLGTVAQPRPAIFDGEDVIQQTFIGVSNSVSGLTQTFNLGSGVNQTVITAPSYFDWTSSNPGVATIDETGVYTIVSAGTAVITGSLAGVDAVGSLTLESLGDFTPAPTPTRDPSLVISIFSDAYTNVPVDYYNGYFAPFQTTQGQDDLNINGDNVISYTDLNFVGIGTFLNVAPINATEMTHFHADINVQEMLDPGDQLTIQLINNVGGNEISGSVILNSSQLLSNDWASFDIPLANFSGLSVRDQLGLVFFISSNSSNVPTISKIFVDNIYYYEVPTTPTVAAPTPTDPEANVISLFSDAYTDVPVDTWRTPWSFTNTVLNDITVDGNATKEYVDLGFVGIETIANQIDASGMTHFRMDTWSSTYTSFNIKLVDAGADGVVGNADDTDHELSFSNPATGEWVSWDIPLSDFTGLTTTSNMAQLVLVAQPFGSTKVYVDNVYFRN